MRRLPFLHAMWLMVALAMALPDLAAAEVIMEAQVDKRRLPPGEVFQYSVIMSGSMGSFPRPDIQGIEQFDIVGGPNQSSSFSFGTGQGMTSQMTYSFYLRARDPGSYTLGPASIQAGGTTITSDPITIEVIDTGRSAPSQQQQPGQARQPAQQRGGQGTNIVPGETPDGSQDLFVHQSVETTRPYVGQQIRYTWRFWMTRKARQALRDYNPNFPTFNGFWAERMEQHRQEVQHFGGQPYYLEEFTYSLTPQTAGLATIGETSVDLAYRVFFRNPNNPTNVAGRPGEINLQVQPLPRGGRPSSFAGGVGSYEISASVDKSALKTGEALTYRLQLKGEGNLNSLEDFDFDDLDDAGFRVFEPEVNTVLDKRRYPIAGNMEVKVILVPRKAGTYELPPRELTFFNPSSQRYETARTTGFTIRVEQGEEQEEAFSMRSDQVQSREAVLRTDEDIHYLMTEFHGARRKGGYVFRSPVYWGAAALGPLVFLAGVIVTSRRERMSTDVGYARRKLASGALRRRLSEAEAVMNDGEEVFYAALSKAILEFIADQFNRQAAGLTMESVDGLLQDAGASAEVRGELRALLETCDMARFGAAAGSGAATLREDYDRAVTALGTLQKELPGG